MGTYVRTYDGAAKDAVNAVITGADFDSEFDLIANAVNSKLDQSGGTVTGTLLFTTLNSIDLDGNRIIFDIDGDSYVQSLADDKITWTFGGISRHVFDGQHVGFGVTTLANWTNTGLQVGGAGSIWSDSGSTFVIGKNYYYDTTYRYVKNSNSAQIVFSGSGDILLRTAPSGTAGNAINWTDALTINNDGNISIGNSTFYNWGSLGTAIEFGTLGTLWNDGSSTTTVGQNYYYNGAYYYQANNYAQMISFDSAGAINFLVAPSGTGGTGISWTKVLTIDNNGVSTFGGFNSTAARDVISLTPTDYGANNPKFFIYKGNTASRWAIGLFNGTTNNIGVLEFAAGGFNFTNNGVWIGNPTGGNKGPGSLNAQTIYENGVRVAVEGAVDSNSLSSTTTVGTFPVPPNGTYTIPKGLYILNWRGVGPDVDVHIRQANGVWETWYDSSVATGSGVFGMVVWSDGINVRLAQNDNFVSSNVKYRKLG